MRSPAGEPPRKEGARTPMYKYGFDLAEVTWRCSREGEVTAVALLVLTLLAFLAASVVAQPLLPSVRIYVVDTVNDRVVRFDDMTGVGWTAFGSRGTGVGQFRWPDGIAVDGSSRVYVTDGHPETQNHRVVRIDDLDGRGWAGLGSRGGGANQFNSPSGIWVDGAGHIYVADCGNHRVVRMDDLSGAGWVTFGRQGLRDNAFVCPSDIAFDRAGRIYIGDNNNNRIVRIDDLTGRGWAWIGSPGCFRNCLGRGQFWLPSGLFIDGEGRIYVSDTANNRVVRMNDLTGAGWTTFGQQGKSVGQFHQPSDIFVDTAGRIYVVDRSNNRIVRMNDMTGSGWAALGSEGREVNQFQFPYSIYVR